MEASRFLATTTAESDRGSARKGRASQKSSNHQDDHAPCVLACRSFVKSKDCSVWVECVPVEQDGEVRVTCVRDELVRDLGHVISGFLQDDRMKPSTRRCKNLGAVSACWAWVPTEALRDDIDDA